jgi:transposase
MPDVGSTAPERVRLWVALDVHKFSIVAATLPPSGGAPELHRIETTPAAIRRFIERLGGAEGLAVCYEAGPGGYDLLRLLTRLGVACDVIAPSPVPVRAGERVKTDKRDAKKLVRLYRAGELRFVAPPSPEHEGLRDLVRCRDDIRRARTAARHQLAKQLLRHGHVYREGKKAWTKQHIAWVRRQALEHPLAQRALEHARAYLDSLDAQLAAIDGELARIATTLPWRDPVRWLCAFRGIGYRTALGLLAEIGDWHRFSHPRELAAYLGLVPSEYSSGDQRHRGHITKTGNQHARRLLVEAARHYQHRPRRTAADADVPPEVAARAWTAQVRLHHRHRALTSHGKRSTVATVAVARELAGFLWAAMTQQPLRDQQPEAAAA